MQKYQNWMSEGTMEAPARCGAKEKGPTVSSAPSATASAPARLRAVRLFTGRLFMGRRFTGAGESTGYCLLRARKLALRTGEPGLSGMTLGDTGISGLPGQHASPFGTLFLFLVRTGRGP
jgi:hypothetical protein